MVFRRANWAIFFLTLVTVSAVISGCSGGDEAPSVSAAEQAEAEKAHAEAKAKFDAMPLEQQEQMKAAFKKSSDEN
jgi:hypothetical protein